MSGVVDRRDDGRFRRQGTSSWEHGAMTQARTTRAQVAVVTGGGSGIGRATALALAGDGWHVVVTGRRCELLDDVVAEIAGAGGPDALAVPADVADEAQVDALFDATVDRFGRVDLLFNNAGVGAPPVPFDELTLDQWRHVVDVNLTGSFLCARAAVGRMKRQEPTGGRIINNGSISAHVPRPHSAPYTTTKHAITGLTKALALDGRAHGITCGQIDIGNAATPLTAPMAIGMPQADGSVRAEPTMDVDDVARAVVYMAGLPSDANVLTMTVMAAGMPYVGRG
jgi:NAD(P)-dependent dehydrogenase (short-subunit alcohol dehydrogenase family)